MAKRNGIIKALIQIGLILVVLALIFFSLNSVLPGFIDVLANGQQSDVQEYLNSFHDFSGYAIGFLLQFIQIITIALPSVPIQVAVGVIFGTWRGFLCSSLAKSSSAVRMPSFSSSSATTLPQGSVTMEWPHAV